MQYRYILRLFNYLCIATRWKTEFNEHFGIPKNSTHNGARKQWQKENTTAKKRISREMSVPDW